MIFKSDNLMSSLLSVVLLTLALTVLFIGRWIDNTIPDMVIVREVSLISSPPPPPPSVFQETVIQTPVNIQVQGTGNSIPMLQFITTKIDIKSPDAPTFNATSSDWQSLDVNWEALSLDDLDVLPKLLTPISAIIPKSLSRKGVNLVLVKLDVVINEQGSVTLINIVKNPYPELKGEILKIVRASRFSPPTKDKVVVRARFIWPIEIKS